MNRRASWLLIKHKNRKFRDTLYCLMVGVPIEERTCQKKTVCHTLTHTSAPCHSPHMARKTVYIPDELIEQLEQSGTDIAQSLSREFQEYLRNRIAKNATSPQWSSDLDSKAEIAELKAEDIDAVVEIWDDTDDGWHLNEISRRRVTDNLRRTIDHADAFCLVAHLDDRVVGFVTASISGHPVMPGRALEIEEITVHRDYQRRRIGSDLMKSALRWLDIAGLRPIRCTYPTEDAAWLKPFLLSLGFECDQSVANIWPR